MSDTWKVRRNLPPYVVEGDALACSPPIACAKREWDLLIGGGPTAPSTPLASEGESHAHSCIQAIMHTLIEGIEALPLYLTLTTFV